MTSVYGHGQCLLNEELCMFQVKNLSLLCSVMSLVRHDCDASCLFQVENQSLLSSDVCVCTWWMFTAWRNVYVSGGKLIFALQRCLCVYLVAVRYTKKCICFRPRIREPLPFSDASAWTWLTFVAWRSRGHEGWMLPSSTSSLVRCLVQQVSRFLVVCVVFLPGRKGRTCYVCSLCVWLHKVSVSVGVLAAAVSGAAK